MSIVRFLDLTVVDPHKLVFIAVPKETLSYLTSSDKEDLTITIVTSFYRD